MGEVRISIPDDLHKKLKMIALEEGTSLKDLVITVLKAYAKGESATDKTP